MGGPLNIRAAAHKTDARVNLNPLRGRDDLAWMEVRSENRSGHWSCTQLSAAELYQIHDWIEQNVKRPAPPKPPTDWEQIPVGYELGFAGETGERGLNGREAFGKTAGRNGGYPYVKISETEYVDFDDLDGYRRNAVGLAQPLWWREAPKPPTTLEQFQALPQGANFQLGASLVRRIKLTEDSYWTSLTQATVPISSQPHWATSTREKITQIDTQ